MYQKIETEGWKVSNPFRVITSVSVYDVNDDEEKLQALVDEQDKIVESRGLSQIYPELLKTSEGYGYNSIVDALDCLPLKDGADLVEFEDGNLGYVGYYHGFDENWFEIIPTKTLSEHCDLINDRTIIASEDGLNWIYEVPEAKVKEASEAIEWSISAFYEDEEYEQTCIGDIIEEQFKKKGIEYTYTPCN